MLVLLRALRLIALFVAEIVEIDRCRRLPAFTELRTAAERMERAGAR
jgi:hypothetical protein